MANPPITIGPFANVPAPGSPIRSDWPQQLTTYAVNLASRGEASTGAGKTGITLTASPQVVTNTIIASGGGLNIVVFSLTLNIGTAPCSFAAEIRLAADNSVLRSFYGAVGSGVNGFSTTATGVMIESAPGGSRDYYGAAWIGSGSAITVVPASTLIQVFQLGAV